MTENETTSLLCSFQLKIEDAIMLVPKMDAAEKLKSVQFWNYVSGKLQEIVNSSAADINALALKLEDCNKRVTFHIECTKADTTIPAMGNYSTEFISDTTNFVTCSETNQVYPSKSLCTNQNEQYISASGASYTSICFPEPSSSDTVMNLHETVTEDNDSICFSKPLMASNCDHMVSIADTNPHQKVSSSSEDGSCVETCEPIDYQITTNKLENSKSIQESNYTSPIMHAVEQKCDNDSYLLQLLTHAASGRDFEADSLEIIDSHLTDMQASSSELCAGNVLISDQHSSFAVAEKANKSNSIEKDITDKIETQNVSDGNFSCDWCDQSFPDNSSLDAHRVTHAKPFHCSQCHAQFSSKGNLRVHFRKHTGEKPFSCAMCTAHFSTRGNLKRHLRSHAGLKPHQCTHCGSRFTEKKSLIVHMRRHTGEKPYECEICRRKFSQSGILRSHMAVHLNERAHLCEHCGKAFRQKSQLRVHMLRHEGVRKFSCKQCSARFLIKGDLERHKRVHTGERPFLCDICCKSFTRQQSLKEHLNRHSGLKPFECKYCTKSFAEMSACYKHMKHHEKMKSQDNNPNPEDCAKVAEEGSSAGSLHKEKVNALQSQSFLVIFQDCDPELEVHSEFIIEKEESMKTSSLLQSTIVEEELTVKH